MGNNYYEKGPHSYLNYESNHFAYYIYESIAEEWFLSFDTAIEIGAGMGRFSAPVVENFSQVILIEPYHSFAEVLRNKFSKNGLQIQEVFAEDFFSDYSVEKPVMIFGFHIMHHLTSDSRRVLYDFVKKTGSTCVFVEPNPYNPLILIQLMVEPDLSYSEEKQYLKLTKRFYHEEFMKNDIVMKSFKRICFIPPFVTHFLLKRIPKRLVSLCEVFNAVLPFFSSYQVIVFERRGE